MENSYSIDELSQEIVGIVSFEYKLYQTSKVNPVLTVFPGK